MQQRGFNVKHGSNRRRFLKSAGFAGALSAVGFSHSAELEASLQNVNRNSSPSDLKITDMRVAVIGPAPMRSPIIRIDTNQGISGYGEVRDGASKTYALMLKSRILGENPCNVDKIFRKIKQFGHHARQAGGVCAVEMACWDLAGKAWGVPAYQMLGGKFRDKIRLYSDTTQSSDPELAGERLKGRIDQGYTFLKVDFGVNLLRDIPGALNQPVGQTIRDLSWVQHPFTGLEINEKGIEFLSEYVGRIREIIGMEIPVSSDHFGHIGLNSCIRLGKAMEKHQLAWVEDMVPWHYTDLLKEIRNSIDIPLCTGEDIYLKEPFRKLVEEQAVDVIHPDLASSGGLLETKKIGDLAMESGVVMAMHYAGTPFGFLASVHCAAATENFLCLEHHGVDTDFWEDLVVGIEKPIVQNGFVNVPDTPGLGVEPNEEVIKEHLYEPGYFEPTPEWDQERAWDRLWS
ncbi:MAG: mandelate racemase/muconate lactonizing enzyme family protein [Acidobacteriota bacterium]|nr:MAG: mandelate racemase/muconate lactonizing enzyme family protein [Acidobacteriota bacterium]